MSRRSTSNYIPYRDSPFRIDNEPEEGEIVDDYDLIVSSDEELCMRQRIRELEAENEEIEQIAVISRSFINKFSHPRNHLENSRAAEVPTDVSSISSTEFVTPKKRKRRKSREHKKKHYHRQHTIERLKYNEQTPQYDLQQLPLKSRSKRTYCKRKQKLLAKKHKKLHSSRLMHKEVNVESMSLESLESSGSSSVPEAENYSCNWPTVKRKVEQCNKRKYITRDTLRLAVRRYPNESRSTSQKYCLKEKLLSHELWGHPSNTATKEPYTFIKGRDIDDEDDDVQVIENEPDIQTIDEDTTNSAEENELRIIALKSAVLKKHLARKMRNAEAAYSPTDFDEMISSGVLSQDKLNDVDLIDLEAEDSQTAGATVSPDASPQLMMLEDQEESQQIVDCKPVDMDIANSDSEDETINNCSKNMEHSLTKSSLESYDFTQNIQYDFYLQNLHEAPPPPPGVDDYDVPAPPPYHMLYNANSQDLDMGNEKLKKDLRIEKETKMTESDRVLGLQQKNSNKKDEDEEEEEALRALLLSKFHSPKNKKKNSRTPKEIEESNNISNQSKMTEWNSKTKPTEIILKEAVKRLKVYSQSELCKTGITTIENLQQYPENTCYLLNHLEKLRKQIEVYKSKPHSSIIENGIDDANECIHEQKQIDPNIFMGETGENTVASNISEMTNTIDISDITRRLQKIKENVLNSNYNFSSKNQSNSVPLTADVVESSRDSFEIAQNSKESNQYSEENNCYPNKMLTDNSVNILPVNKVTNNALSESKTVKANFNVIANPTTLKVTITNKAAFKSESNDITNTVGYSPYKENNSHNLSSNLTLKVNGDIRSKLDVNRNKIVNNINKKKSNEQLYNPTIVKAVLNDVKVTPPLTCSLLRNTKIIKPNKVINTNIELKLKQISQTAELTSTLNKSKPEMINQLSNVSENSRLITSIDQVKHMCKVKPFVISLQNSSNESTEDECVGDYDSFYKPLHDYNDNASPLSLNLESPSRTPLRSNSPIDHGVEENISRTNLEAFNLKTKITSLQNENEADKTPLLKTGDQGGKINKTPLAVRHLPAAAQSEYRRLVHRMKLLENKRKLANIECRRKEITSSTKTHTTSSVTEDLSKEKINVDSTNSTLSTSLVKKVLLRNATTKATSTASTANNTQLPKDELSSGTAKSNKSNVLRSYENLYLKFGTCIVNNLDKSLKLVEEAKTAKIAKLMLENRIKELKAEMDVLQDKHTEEQQKISRIYPNICTTNEVITSLKQKRSKVFKAALNLGKSLRGDCYRLNNELKDTITSKSNNLAAEIRIVNSLKATDVTNLKEIIKPNATLELQNDNKEKKNDYKAKSKGNNIEMIPIANTTMNNINICSTRCKEDEEQDNLKHLLKIDDGGNTEFQNSDSNNDNANACLHDVNTKLNNACTEKSSAETLPLLSYISPLEHLRNIDSNLDPNGVVCPFDLMGNCEDVTCKYAHITPKTKT